MSFTVSKIWNIPTIFLGIELSQHFLRTVFTGIHYDFHYVLWGLLFQIPLFVFFSFLPASPEMKSWGVIVCSFLARLVIYLWVQSTASQIYGETTNLLRFRLELMQTGNAASYGFVLGLLPLILYYYIQFQRTLGMSEIEKQKNIEPV